MEKVLSEKNKQIRLRQRLFERLRHRVRLFYPSAFVVDKHGVRVPYRRPGAVSAGQNRKIDMKKTNELLNIWHPAPVEPNGTDAVETSDASAPQAMQVGTIGHDRSVLDEPSPAQEAAARLVDAINEVKAEQDGVVPVKPNQAELVV